MIHLKKTYLLRGILLLLIIATLSFIWSNSLADAEESREMSGVVVEIAKPIIDPYDKVDDDLFVMIVRKMAHFTEFAMLGAEFYLLIQTFKQWRRCTLPSFILTLIGGFLCATTDELLQLTSSGRACRFIDILIDLSGVASGAAAMILITLIIEYIKKIAGK